MKKLLVALAALALALMAGQYGAQEAHAQTVDLSIGVVGDPCETGTGDTDCDVTVGSTFTVKVNLNSFTSPTGDYGGIQAHLQESAGLTYQDRPGVGECVWPDSFFPADNETGLPGDYLVVCSMVMPPWSTYTGVVIEVDYTCPASPSAESVTIVHGPPNDTYIVDGFGNPITEAGTEVLTINCVEAPTPTPTPPPVTPTPPPGVGGVVELLADGSDAPASAAAGSGSSTVPYAAVAGSVAAALALLGAGALYARKRLS